MAVPFFKLYHYKEGSSEYTDLSNLIDIRQARGLEAKANSMNFRLNNPDGIYNNFFTQMDTVKLWLGYSPIDVSSDIPIIIGLVQEFSEQISDTGNFIDVKCIDRTLHFLNRLWAQYIEDTPPNMIESIINATTDVGDRNYTVDARTVTKGGHIQDTRSGYWKGVNKSGVAFDTVQYSAVFKTVYEWINDLSQSEWTHDDKTYIFYVDENNSFWWFYPVDEVDGSLAVTDLVYNAKFSKSTFDVVNVVIYNAGKDLASNGMTGYYVSPNATSQNISMKYYDWSGDISESLKSDERRAMDKNSITYDSDGYPDNYTLYNNANCNTWNDNTITDDSTYLSRFRSRCRNGYTSGGVTYDGLGRMKSQRLCERLSELRWKGNIELKGTTTFNAGDLIQVTHAEIGLSSQKLRIMDVIQNYSSSGWFTTLDLEEDQKAILST